LKNTYFKIAMNKTLAGFFGIKDKVASAVVDAVVDSITGKEAAETDVQETGEGTPSPVEEIEPTVAEAVTGEDTDTPVDAPVGEETLEEDTTDAESNGEVGEETVPGVEMASLPAAELSQIRADAASWNTHKGEFAVLQNWYKNTTGAARVGATADAADVAPAKKKSWEKAPWNN
jgi:hypothetical protein